MTKQDTKRFHPDTYISNASTPLERITHWMLAGSCIVLFITGIGFMFRSLNFIQKVLGFPHGAKVIHHSAGVVFIISLVLAIFVWISDCFFDAEDIKWFKVLGGYLIRTDEHFNLGKFNPGQKIFTWYCILFGIVISITGYIMWAPFSFSRYTVQISYPIHALCAFLFGIGWLGHWYLGAWANPGSVSVITSGRARLSWCLHHRPRWLKKMEEEGKLHIAE
ncbi:MAG: formate dehydrogenase subunit gamma [bacterium]